MQLTPFSPNEWEYIARWFYSEEYRAMWRHQPKVLTKYDFERYPQTISGDVYFISLRSTGKIIGMAQMIPDWKTNRAFCFGLLIDKNFQKARISTEATFLLFDYAFNRLGYRKAIVEALESDKSLIKTLESTGFLKEASYISEAYMDGRFVNEVRYCMLSSFFNKRGKEEQEKAEKWRDSLKS